MHDQEFNLDRVEELGIGIQLSELQFKPTHLLEAVEKVLTDPEFKTNTRRLQQILANCNAPKKGAALIASF